MVSIRDRVQSGMSDEGWAIYTDGSLRYRGRVVVPPVDRSEREDPQRVPQLSIYLASMWHEDVP